MPSRHIPPLVSANRDPPAPYCLESLLSMATAPGILARGGTGRLGPVHLADADGGAALLGWGGPGRDGEHNTATASFASVPRGSRQDHRVNPLRGRRGSTRGIRGRLRRGAGIVAGLVPLSGLGAGPLRGGAGELHPADRVGFGRGTPAGVPAERRVPDILRCDPIVRERYPGDASLRAHGGGRREAPGPGRLVPGTVLSDRTVRIMGAGRTVGGAP